MLKEFELYFQCNSLSVILIDSVYEKDKSYYTQAFLEECKYVVKEKGRLSLLQTTEVSPYDSDDSDKEDSDKEISNEEN